MIIKDIRGHFFDQLKGRILIMCALDVDAICACRILQFLLETYNLQYSVAAVADTENFWRSFEVYRNSVDSIVLINFGNLINIPKLLKPAENLNFYVIDSHRPINVYNYYKNPQVKILINDEERDLNIPSQRKIFLKNDSGLDDDDDDENFALLTADVRSLSNEQLEKREELRAWYTQKQKLLFDYEEFHFYNRSVAVIMYDLANILSKNNNYLLWLGIVGLTYQLRSEKIADEQFEEEAEKLIRYLSRNRVSSSHARGNTWQISWQKDIKMDLYRRWSVFESLYHTQITVCKFRLWNDKGQSDLRGFLVDCGIKELQCRRPYVTMQLDDRKIMLTAFEKVCLGEQQDKYNLQELISRTFVLTSAFKDKFCANDIVLAVRAILESHDPTSSTTEKFVRAIQSLSYNNFVALDKGFEAARTQLKSMFAQVKALITTQKVIDEGAFLYADLQDHADISKDFARGDSLVSFAKFVLKAYVSSKPTRIARRAIIQPLILLSPDYHDPEQVIIVGVPPLAQESKKNFFAKAFEQAAEMIDCEIRADLSETSLVRVNANYKYQLFAQVKSLME